MERLEKENLGRAVIGGRIRFLSVSQIEKFDPDSSDGCPRKWYYGKVLGHKEKQGDGAKKGDISHDQIQHTIKTGLDSLSPILRVGKHFIPQFQPGMLVETSLGVNLPLVEARDRMHELETAIDEFGDGADVQEYKDLRVYAEELSQTRLTANGIPVVGYIDLVNPTGITIDMQGETKVEERPTVEVVDWKTTKSIQLYAKTGSGLIRTVQMPGYGEWVTKNYPDVEVIRLSHVYFQTEGKKLADKRTALVQLETVKRRWDAIESTVRTMVDVAKEKDVNKVPTNLTACGAYGGCAFKPMCSRPLSAVLAESIGKGSAMSLLQRRTPGGTPNPNTNAPLVAAAAAQGTTNSNGHAAQVAAGDAANVQAEKARLLAEENAARTGASAPPVQTTAAKVNTEIAAIAAKYGGIYMLPSHGYQFGRANVPTYDPSTGGTVVPFQSLSGEVLRLATTLKVVEPAIVPPEVINAFAALTVPQAPANAAPVVTAPVHPATSNAVPPDAPKSDPAKAADAIPPGSNAPPAVVAAAQGMALPQPEKATTYAEAVDKANASAAAPAVQTAPAGEPAKRGPGRPRKSKPETTGAAAQVPDTGADADDLPDGVIVGLYLFVDCFPMFASGTACVPLDAYCAEKLRVLATQFDVADVRCAPEGNPLSFGKWKGALAALVQSEPPAPGCYNLLFTRESELKQVIADALMPRCELYSRGL